jgi:hypothetical protein
MEATNQNTSKNITTKKPPSIPLFSFKDIVIDSVNVIPWFVLLIIVGIIIII